MSLPRTRLGVIAVLATTCGALPSNADVFDFAKPTTKAIKKFADATTQILKAKTAMESIAAGQKPTATSKDWQGVIGYYEEAADEIKASEGPDLPEAASFHVSFDDLRGCDSRPAALVTLKQQLSALRDAVQSCDDTDAMLQEKLAEAEGADKARRYLAETAVKLTGEATLGHYFVWKWYDLEVPVAQAIATYVTELKRYRMRLLGRRKELATKIANLEGWLSDFASAIDCTALGTWTGTATANDGSRLYVTMRLVSSGRGYSGNVSVDGDAAPITSAVVDRRTNHLRVAFDNNNVVIEGTLSNDGHSFQGTISERGASIPVALTH